MAGMKWDSGMRSWLYEIPGMPGSYGLGKPLPGGGFGPYDEIKTNTPGNNSGADNGSADNSTKTGERTIYVPPPAGGTGSDQYAQLLAQIKAENDRIIQQRQEEKAASDAALAAQNKIREDARTQALAALPGIQQKLGADLLDQQKQSFSRLQPQIDARLNALGILQSGALPEAYAKYQSDLESQRQAKLADFSTSAANSLQIQQPIVNAGQNAQGVSDDLLRNIDLGRAGLSRQFALSDVFRQEEMARQQMAQALAEARRARQERSPQFAGSGSRGQNTITTIGPTMDFTPGGNMYPY